MGMAASDPNIRSKVDGYGYRPIPMETGLEILENLIAADIARVGVMNLDVNAFTARNYIEKTGFCQFSYMFEKTRSIDSAN